MSWVTPRHIDFGTIDPGDIIERDYTITVPRNQKPGYYELIWKFSCKYTDGTACTVKSDTVFQITVKGKPAPTAATGNKYISRTLTPGEELSEYLEWSTSYDSFYGWADASGEAASWATPRHIDFGVVEKGKSTTRYYTLKVPEYQRSGYYELIWTSGCKYVSGQACSVTGDTVLQITVEASPMPTFTKSGPVYTPMYTPTTENQTTPIIIGLTFILILFIIWIYVVVWVARDANKRGTSGTLWGILTLFLGLIGLLIYLLVRPKGYLVLCDYCGREKLETLTRCPHCNKTTEPAFKPTQTHIPAPYPAETRKPQETKAELSASKLTEVKGRLSKINELLDKLDERLAQGEITEAKYKELSEKYRAEADSLKNLISEKELMDEVGL